MKTTFTAFGTKMRTFTTRRYVVIARVIDLGPTTGYTGSGATLRVVRDTLSVTAPFILRRSDTAATALAAARKYAGYVHRADGCARRYDAVVVDTFTGDTVQ